MRILSTVSFPLIENNTQDSCSIYSAEDIDLELVNQGFKNAVYNKSIAVKCQQWTYSKIVFDKTIVTEVCHSPCLNFFQRALFSL